MKYLVFKCLFACFVLIVCASAQAKLSTEVKQLIRVGQYQQAEQLLLVKAERGDPEAAYQLARLYHGNLVTAPQKDSVFAYFHQAAEAGHVESMFQLGREFEQHPRQDFSQAQLWYSKAAQAGHARAAQSFNRLRDREVVAASKNPRATLLAGLQTCDPTRTREALGGRSHGVANSGAWLHTALDCKHPLELVRILIEAGVQLSGVDGHGNTPLHLAIAKEQAATAKFLIANGADERRKNAEGWTPHMLAQRSSSAEIRALFGAPVKQKAAQVDYAQLAQSQRFSGWSALHIAAWRGDTAAVKQMLADGVDIDHRDGAGKTALSRALERGQVEVAAVMLERQADFDKAEIDLVFGLNDSQLKRMLVAAGTDTQDIHDIGCASLHQGEQDIPAKLHPLGWQVNQPCSGQLPLVMAAKKGRLEQVQALLDMGASVNLLGEQNCSALCWSTRRNLASISHLLIEAGAKNLPDSDGDTPLMFAASQGDIQSVKGLLERGASPSEQSHSGSHALLLAASTGQLAIVKHLLENSAPVDLKNNVGDTPLILAVRDNQPDVAALLLQHGASARARNDRLESARSLAADKDDERWVELFQNRGSFWTLVTRD